MISDKLGVLLRRFDKRCERRDGRSRSIGLFNMEIDECVKVLPSLGEGETLKISCDLYLAAREAQYYIANTLLPGVRSSNVEGQQEFQALLEEVTDFINKTRPDPQKPLIEVAASTHELL